MRIGRMATLLLLAGGLALPLAAQEPELPAGDVGDPAQAEVLRQRIEERFGERLRQELQLSDDQAAQLRRTTREYALRRRDLMVEERQLKQALAGQMRPGIAADQDSVARLTERLTRTRGDLARSYQDEVQALGFLTPVQRARYLQLRERLLERVREVRARRGAAAGEGGGLPGDGSRVRRRLRDRP